MLEQEEWNVALGQAKFVEMSALPGELSGHHVEEETQGLER